MRRAFHILQKALQMKRIDQPVCALLLLALLAACSPSRTNLVTTTPMPADTETPPPQPTLVPTETPTSKPTATWVPTVTPKPPTPTAPPDAAFLATMDAIQAEMSELRGLELSTPITRTLMTREELTTYLEGEFAKEYPAAEVEEDVLVMSAFDFVPKGFDLWRTLLDLYSSEVLGLYDDELDTFYIVSRGDFEMLDRLTVAHETTHGLQDQRFGLDTFIEEQQLNDDELLARMALVEGDATLAMTEYLVEHMAELSADDLAALMEETSQGSGGALHTAPPIIRETFVFPYVQGLEFVSIIQADGWEAVDMAYADPPQSTEQILHPERYLSRDEPKIVALPPMTDTLGSGWYLVESEILGEFQTNLYLRQQVDEETADSASQGWDGDRYAVYSNGDAILLAFASVWDSPEDRVEFVDAYRRYAEGKYGEFPTRSTDAALWWETPDQTTVLTWEEEAVLIIIGPESNSAARVLSVAKP